MYIVFQTKVIKMEMERYGKIKTLFWRLMIVATGLGGKSWTNGHSRLTLEFYLATI